MGPEEYMLLHLERVQSRGLRAASPCMDYGID